VIGNIIVGHAKTPCISLRKDRITHKKTGEAGYSHHRVSSMNPSACDYGQNQASITSALPFIWKARQYVAVNFLERQRVQSSTLRSVSYDEARKNLEIEFHSGIIHQYQNVPSKIYTDLMNTSFVGIFYTEKIKNRFRSICIDGQTIK
jgi:hypothetical protein